MQKWMNKVMISRKHKVIIDEARMCAEPVQSRDAITPLLLDIAQLGYTLDSATCDALTHFYNKDLTQFHSDVISIIKELVGAHVNYNPLFKHFPDDIPNDNEYLMRRVLGVLDTFFGFSEDNYTVLSCGHVINHSLFDLGSFGACPVCQMQVPELIENNEQTPSKVQNIEDTTPLTILSLGSKEDFMDLFSSLCTSVTPLSETDRDVVVRTLEHFPKEALFELDFTDVSQKETLVIIIGELIRGRHIDASELTFCLKTTTDVLRLAVYLSGGDVSLKESTRFVLTKRERKIILKALESVVIRNIEQETSINIENDLMRYQEMWKRLFHHVHIGAYRDRFKHAYSFAHELRNKPKMLKNGSMATLIEHLIVVNQNKRLERTNLPLDHKQTVEQILMEAQVNLGVFGRSFDAILRNCGDKKEQVLQAFEQTVKHLTTVNLLKMSKVFEHRNNPLDFRFFIPKGKTANIKITEGDNREPLDSDTINQVQSIIWENLNTRVQKQSSMGDVYIDPALKNYLIPTSQRSASEQLKTLTRGSRASIGDDTKVIRFFLYWKENNTSGRVDVDLSAVSFDANWRYKEHLSFTQLSSNNGCHSGDIQSAPEGASEFIDLNIDKFLKDGHRYIMMNCLSYTRQAFNQFDAFAGFMSRNSVKSDEHYDPKKVDNKFQLQSNNTLCAPMVIDLKERCIIWADLSLKGSFRNTVEDNATGINRSGQVIEQMHQHTFNVYDLLNAHAIHRASSIDYEFNPEKHYDFVFDESFGLNIDEIASKWLDLS